ncbi:MAG: DUF4080 domain-containing protein [Rhodoferax sp.]|nr:DUF4080 domain-containing protein [Rhodoferax sp.]
MPLPATVPPRIVLCTLNARYVHASLGLRCLLANMGDLRAQTALCEFTIHRAPHEMARVLLDLLGPVQPGQVQVIGVGVYIWNVVPTGVLLQLLRSLRPGLRIVLGGPEVSHELDTQPLLALADHVITGWGDVSFPRLCRALLHGPRPLQRVIAGEQPGLATLMLPNAEYTDTDLARRVVYVEASRGCPFRCAFCLSALDKTAWAFDLPPFLDALDALYRRGARNFKFVDRTFNLKTGAALQILQFFLDRLPAPGTPASAPDLLVHFELIPDHLPEALRRAIAAFPAGVLQFEVGVQTFDVDVQKRIQRVQDNTRTEAHLRWLVQHTQAHVHADLIFGLPGESLDGFGRGFDRLLALRPHEIQLGVLKRLRGTPLAAQAAASGLVFDPQPPYALRESAEVSARDLQRFTRLARYWDLIANSGRFQRTLALLLPPPPPPGAASGSAFGVLMHLADWLWARTGRTHHLTPEQLVDHLADYLRDETGADPARVQQVLLDDYLASGARARPQQLRASLPPGATPVRKRPRAGAQRQDQHLAAPPQGPAAGVPMADPGVEFRL